MKKLVSIFLVLLCLSCAAQAESVWVEENWQHVYREVDCDGLPMVIDADVMQVAEGTTAQEYHIDRISDAAAKKMVEAIDWETLGFSTQGITWIKDAGYYGGNAKGSVGLYTFGELFGHNNYQDENFPRLYFSKELDEEYLNEPDISPLPLFDFDVVTEYAEKAAKQFKYQLGDIHYMRRYDAEKLTQYIQQNGFSAKKMAMFTERAITDLVCYDVYFPVYYNGMRLYSGKLPSMQGEMFAIDMSMQVCMRGDGIAEFKMPILNNITEKDKKEVILTSNKAIETIQHAYMDMYLPGIESITVHEVCFEYIAISGDPTAKTGFTLYPVWWMRLTMRENGRDFERYNGFHAITGKQLF